MNIIIFECSGLNCEHCAESDILIIFIKLLTKRIFCSLLDMR